MRIDSTPLKYASLMMAGLAVSEDEAAKSPQSKLEAF
jgi:hypothetical protein